MSETQWHYAHNEERHGPVSVSELKALLKAGQLQPSDIVWQTGMAEWRPLSECMPELFRRTPSPTGQPATDQKSDAGVWQQAAKFAKTVGQATASAVQQEEDDVFANLDGSANDPAIFLRSEYFGGRSKIGIPLSAMNKPLFIIAAALFSWPVLLGFLWSTPSAWEFLPFKRTEFLRIRLRQVILWRKITVVFMIWLACNLVAVVLARIVGEISVELAFVVFLAGSIAANLAAWKLISGIGDRLFRSSVYLEYGFPAKYRLLCGYSDAPMKAQLEGVLRLCEAISRSEFAPWPQISTHGSRSGLLSAIYSRIS